MSKKKTKKKKPRDMKPCDCCGVLLPASEALKIELANGTKYYCVGCYYE